jgi:hypothetical protein
MLSLQERYRLMAQLARLIFVITLRQTGITEGGK